MSTLIGSPSTVQQMIDLLAQYPPDTPVRVSTGYHDFVPDVRKHERCITIEP